MSQSGKVLREIGSVSIKRDARLITGSTVAVELQKTPDPTVLSDADATLTVAQIKSGVLVQTPTASRVLTLPTAALTKVFLKNVGDSVDFNVINEGADGLAVTLAAGSGGTTIGSLEVRDKVATTTPASGTSCFRIRQTNVTASSEAYVLYRLA